MFDTVIVSFVACVLILKDFAYLWATCELVGSGARHAGEMRKGDWTLRVNAPAAMNPVDTFLSVAVPSGSRAGTTLLALWTTPSVITMGSLVLFTTGPDTGGNVQLVLGVAIALCSILALMMAVLRRLVLGSRDWETSDVQLPEFFSEWAVSTEAGANNSVYFLVLVYLSIVGFAALYFSMEVIDGSGFAHFGSASVITALYLSITTLATVGYGDIHAVSDLARVAVIVQISTGPLLLSWLLSALLASREGNRSRANPVSVHPAEPATVAPPESSAAGGRKL
jgi:hypothetical protein